MIAKATQPRRGNRLTALLWAPVNAVQVALAMLWTVVCFFLAIAVVGVRRGPAALGVVRRLWAPGLLALAGARLEVVGCRDELPEAALFVANHRSALDIPALFAALPVPLYFLIKRELATAPFVGWFCRAVGMVFVDRTGGEQAHQAIDAAARLLSSGRCMVAFPEGTRGRGDGARPFKRGPFVAAIKARAPVVPVAIVGAAEVAPPRRLRVRPGRISVRLGEPIPTDELRMQDRRDLAHRAERAVATLAGAEEGA